MHICAQAQRPQFGTHEGHCCQEGIRTWPGDYARRRAGLTILLGPSSQLPVLPPRGQGQAGAPAAAQRRGRTSLTPASGGRSSRARKGPVADWLIRVVCWFPVRGGRSGLTSTHPAPRRRSGGCHDHVSGTGLLSHVIERGAGRRAHAEGRAHPGLGDPPVFMAAAAACWPRRPASGKAGARRGSAACGRSRWWRSSSRGVWRCWSRWRRTPASAWRSARPGS